MPQLILLVGLPGSGKSTLAHLFAEQSPGSLIISTDAIRAKLFGHETIQGPWLLVWRQVQRQFYEAVKQINSGGSPGAIYDATNAARRQRREAIMLARASGFTHIMGIWVNTPFQVCIARNRCRDRTVPEAVIARMSRQLQGAPPALSDGLDELICYFSMTSREIAIASLGENRTQLT